MMHPLPAYAVVLALIFAGCVIALLIGGILAGAARRCPHCDRFKEANEPCDCEGEKQ